MQAVFGAAFSAGQGWASPVTLPLPPVKLPGWGGASSFDVLASSELTPAPQCHIHVDVHRRVMCMSVPTQTHTLLQSHIYKYVHCHEYLHTCTQSYTCKHSYIYIYTYIYVCVCVHTRASTHKHAAPKLKKITITRESWGESPAYSTGIRGDAWGHGAALFTSHCVNLGQPLNPLFYCFFFLILLDRASSHVAQVGPKHGYALLTLLSLLLSLGSQAGITTPGLCSGFMQCRGSDPGLWE